ncbi:MAG: cupredoxin domain-containing protein [Chloroflexi bacterium]|nr:cupredoxin domain-containing protein [Chloroflexota bacterium]
MRLVRRFGFLPAIVFGLGLAWAASAQGATAYTPMVTIIDNDAAAPNQGPDVGQGYWGYGPDMIVVKKGEQITFENPTTNKRPHTITSISLGGAPFDNTLAAGGKFDSSPARESLVTPGMAWALDTSTLDPGNYAYFCRLHPWMVGKFTVTE